MLRIILLKLFQVLIRFGKGTKPNPATVELPDLNPTNSISVLPPVVYNPASV